MRTSRPLRPVHSEKREAVWDCFSARGVVPCPETIPCVLFRAEEDGRVVGFMGISGDKIEMLFIDAEARGKGIGSFLLEAAVRNGAVRVDVNEQNPSALAFYRARGFRITGRDETDDAGRPFPILHLSL